MPQAARSVKQNLVLHATDRREILERDDEAANLFASAAEVAGLAIANLRHAEIEAQKLAADREFAVAARVQRRMLPPDNGEAGPLRFASLIKPGRVIAGDMCSVFEIADDRAAFVVGDVSGKGAGPGLLMAMTLSHLRALLAEGHTIRYAVDRLNRFVFNHSAQNEFVTLLAGIVERGGNVHLVDAGHGLAFLCRDDVVRRITINGGVPLGVISDNAYDSTIATLREDERLLIVSDGVVEQRNQNGEQFQDRGIADALRGSESCESDVRSISRALAAHAGGAAFADDVTILSVLHLP